MISNVSTQHGTSDAKAVDPRSSTSGSGRPVEPNNQESSRANPEISSRFRRLRLAGRLRLDSIDVRTGNWSVLSPQPFDSKALSVGPRRAVADQKLVERLKDRAYEASVRDLLRVYLGDNLANQRESPEFTSIADSATFAL
jgi:hypothetical protein